MNTRDASILRFRATRCLLAALLWSLALPVFALGLGQIQVKSQPGQPLLAEIPIVSSDPAELQGLQARLASPETFRRIGLEPPQGIVSDLQFTPAVDAAGRPVIRVTSTAPVQQAELTFLVEVDWGQGRLVREYSALVDAPRSVAAPIPPPVQAPVLAPAPVIQRPVDAPVSVAPAPTPQPVPPAPAAPGPVPATPPATAAAPAPAPIPAAPPAGEAASELGPVQRGQTLSEIASDLPGTTGYSLDQTMLALLRTNPDAFIGEDINRLRQGAVLRMPDNQELSRYGVAEASAMVREQIANWREARRAQVQPAVAGDTGSVETQAPTAAPRAARTSPAPRRVADARLEIAPPRSTESAQAGTQSGASAGGEGEMLRQELQQTQETLAARDAEVRELQARVAELEQLQKQQQELIALKDNALAGAQQRLTASNAAQAAPAGEPPAADSANQAGAATWWWLLPVALLLAGVVWWLARRRKPAVAAAVPATGERVSDSFAASPVPVGNGDAKRRAARAKREPAAFEPPAETPVWVGKNKTPAPAPAPAVEAAVGATPAWVGAAPAGAETIAQLNPAPAGRERIELARAYADLGDRSTARSLLQEVVAGGDAQARDEAARMLQALD